MQKEHQQKGDTKNQNSLKVIKIYQEVTCYWCGKSKYRKNGKKGKKQTYECRECGRLFSDDVDYVNYKFSFLELNEDVWDAAEIGLKIHKYTKSSKLVFLYFKQDWLKELVKKFIKYQASRQFSFSRIKKYIYCLNRFSDFLAEYYPSITFKTMTREIIIDFIDFLTQQKISIQTKNIEIRILKIFFEIGNINSWFNVSAYLIRPEDFGKRKTSLPRYIPEEVMQQLNQHLKALPMPVMRMVLILQETGLRIGELLELPINCLKFNTKGEPYIQYMNFKMSKEHTKPISGELAKVIQEQQQYIQTTLGVNFDYLFCARKSINCKNVPFQPQHKVMSGSSFIYFLRQLAIKFDIKDNSGKPWNFQSHQFRHTVGTRMVNLGVPLHIIQQYLGHESPTMTMVYAHIHDATLRKEIEKYHESRVVNFQGKTAELDETILSSNDDLEWFKKNVQARALEHGYCARPKVLGDCDIPGFDGCYNCPHWRTNKNFLPVLKNTLERTNNVLEKAQNCGWQLQVDKNIPIKSNLEKVIKSLESSNDQYKD